MTVAELSAELEKHPPDMEVLVSGWVPTRPTESGWTGDYFNTNPIGECHEIVFSEYPRVFVIRSTTEFEEASDA